MEKKKGSLVTQLGSVLEVDTLSKGPSQAGLKSGDEV